MTRRRLSDIGLHLLSVLLFILFLREKFLDFREFQAANPHASGWDFLATEMPWIVFGGLVFIGYVLVAMWFGNSVPPLDADKTEFHEEGLR